MTSAGCSLTHVQTCISNHSKEHTVVNASTQLEGTETAGSEIGTAGRAEVSQFA